MTAPSLPTLADRCEGAPAATVDDAIRERHGCACREGSSATTRSHVEILEGEQYVHLSGNISTRQMTPWQARYLAAKLYRLSRRIRARASTPADASHD